MRQGATLWPRLEQVTAEPETALHLAPGEFGEHGLCRRLVAQGQLVLAQMGELRSRRS